MKTILPILAGLGITAEALRRSIKAAIAAYRAKKSVGNIVADSIEAVIEEDK